MESIGRISYVSPNQSSNTLEFSIPVEKCGTNSLDIDSEDGEQSKRGFENIVVFQNDPVYQEQWDHARMIVCRYSVNDDFDMKDKRVIFKPIVIDMLDVVSIPIQDERGEQSRVDCWMEISKGRFPQTTEIDSAVKVGSPLTLAIFVRDPRKRTDIRIKDCYAYDDPKVAESNGPALLQLTDFEGCPTKPKLIEVWKRTQDTGSTGANIIAFTTVTAFKFPDRPDLQLTCNIELCRSKCANRCASEMPDPISVGDWSKTKVDDGSKVTQSTKEDDEESEKVDEKEEKEEKEDKDEEEDDERSTGRSAEGDSEMKKTNSDDDKSEDKSSEVNENKEDDEEEKKGEDGESTTEKSDTSDSASSSENDSESEKEEEKNEKKTEDKKEESAEKKDEASEEEEEDAKNDETKPEAKKADEEEEEEEEEGDSKSSELEKRDNDNAIASKDDEEEEDEEEKVTTTTTTTTTTMAPTTVKSAKNRKRPTLRRTTTKKPKTTTTTVAPKSAAQTLQDDVFDNSISASTKSKKFISANQMSTTTLRPLKELMNFAGKVGSKANKLATSSLKKASNKSKVPAANTTTTITTTAAPTTTKKPKKSLKKSTKSIAQAEKAEKEKLANGAKPRRARNPSNTHPNEHPDLHKPSSNIQRYRDYDAPLGGGIADIRSFYAYHHFQPQRIRSRTVRSVDSVQFDPKQGSRILGARVITGLEVI